LKKFLRAMAMTCSSTSS